MVCGTRNRRLYSASTYNYSGRSLGLLSPKIRESGFYAEPQNCRQVIKLNELKGSWLSMGSQFIGTEDEEWWLPSHVTHYRLIL